MLAARRSLTGLALCLPLCVPLVLGPAAAAQEGGAEPAAPAQPAAAQPGQDAAADPPAFTPEQLEQMLAPIALYPDDLLSQVLMACTYPLEIVQADRWAKLRKDKPADQAAKELEAEDWDASVKSLVAVPEVLAMLSDELDWTQQVGDAFIAQPKDVLATVQTLRLRAHEAGQLETSEQQTIKVEPEEGPPQVIVIESAEPDVIYVPVYDTTVVYGGWPYPSYPPYPYYPPAYRVGAAIAIGFAWGYAWGDCDWHGGDVDIDIDRNTNINRDIDRDRYRGEGGLDGGRGTWKHDPKHRGNQPYRDGQTAQRFGGVSTREATASREAFRGRTGGSDPRVLRGGVEGGAVGDRGPTTGDRSQSNWLDPSRASGAGGDTRTSGRTDSRTRTGSGTRSGALDGVDRGGRQVRRESQRGSVSRSRAASRGGAVRGARGGGGRGGRR